ncbi:MAG TPA: hypothetical protein VFY99_06395 [Solirubrobacterales bacterium]
MAAELEDYAKERGLAHEVERELRAVTPLLLSDGKGSTRDVAEGRLPGGLEGFVAHHRYASSGSGGRELTVVVSRVPESLGFVRALSCRSREVEVARSYAKLEFLGRWRELTLESTRFNELYELEVLEGQREAWVRQLFSPAFIDRLASEAADGFCFELNEGHLCVAVPKHLSEPADLDALCAAAADVAARIRQESLEDVGSGEEYAGERAYEAKLREQVAKVAWPAPPQTARQAARSYANRWGLGVKTYARALAWGTGIGAIGAGVALVVPGLDSSTSTILAIVAGLIGLLAFILVIMAAAGSSAARLGVEAFAVEFARSHGFELEDRYEFHARLAQVPLPGRAQHAMRGTLPSGIPATLAFCDDAAEMFSHGQRIAYMANRPLASDVIVAELGPTRPDAGDGLGAGVPEGLEAELHGDTLVVWRPVPGNLDRKLTDVEAFIATADALVAAEARPAPAKRR